ncbi:hypothetical protein, partial [Stenotrophomonas sp. SrG]|uniref:hypothetical protein n=1 Tax=Stenotrophomonas sp. SrG TaxID=3414430 RepID=UPI003CF4F6AC
PPPPRPPHPPPAPLAGRATPHHAAACTPARPGEAAAARQAVVWNGGHFSAQFNLRNKLQLDPTTSNLQIARAHAHATPVY